MSRGTPTSNDFKIVKKLPPQKPIKRIPKKEVQSSDIIQRLVAKPIKAKAAAKELVKKVAALVPAKERFFASAMPAIVAMLVMSLLIQSVAFLLKAKGASGLVLGAATSAYDELDAANQSLEQQDFGAARESFTSAQANLLGAINELDKFRVLTAVAPQARSANNVLSGAYFLAEAGKNLSRAMELFDDLSVNSEGIATQNFTNKLAENKRLLDSSLTLIHHAEEDFNSVSGLPDDYAATLEKAKAQISSLKGVLTDFVNLEDLFLSFFGTNPRTYLLVFENYDEMRGTGGFIGTYGSLKYDNGAIKSLKIESIYNLDGSLTKNVSAPGPFQPEIAKWGLRDANFFVDFPTTAKKLLQFYETESETADGVLALTPHIFVELLRLVGPIPMPEYDVTLTADNFQETVQLKTSVEYDKKLNQPKKFLHDFAPLLLDKLTNLGKEQWFSLFEIIKQDFAQKHIMVYSTQQDVQTKIAKMGFDGRILDADRDYLAVFNSNHGGTKTDLDIKQKINFHSEISSSGQITNTVTIERPNVSDMDNRNFMRVLVPFGSRILEANGFSDEPQFSSQAPGYEVDPDLAQWDKAAKFNDVYVRTEAGKTEFTGWVESRAQTSATVTIKYLLPMQIETSFLNQHAGHSLLIQKQPGNVSTEITGEWELEGYNVDWTSAKTTKEGNKVKFTSDGKNDSFWAVVLNN